MARVREAQAAEASARAQRTAVQPSNGPVAIGAIASVIALLAIGGVVVSLARGGMAARESDKTTEEPAKKPVSEKKTVDEKAEEEAPEEEALPRSAFQDLSGCACKAGKETRQLAVKLAAAGGEGFALKWIADTGGAFFELKGKSPPMEVMGRGMAVGVACAGDVFAIVTDDHVTGWSIKAKKAIWEADLPANYGLPAPASKTALNIQCATVPVAGTKLTVPLVGGKSKSIDINTGK